MIGFKSLKRYSDVVITEGFSCQILFNTLPSSENLQILKTIFLYDPCSLKIALRQCNISVVHAVEFINSFTQKDFLSERDKNSAHQSM